MVCVFFSCRGPTPRLHTRHNYSFISFRDPPPPLSPLYVAGQTHGWGSKHLQCTVISCCCHIPLFYFLFSRATARIIDSTAKYLEILRDFIFHHDYCTVLKTQESYHTYRTPKHLPVSPNSSPATPTPVDSVFAFFISNCLHSPPPNESRRKRNYAQLATFGDENGAPSPFPSDGGSKNASRVLSNSSLTVHKDGAYMQVWCVGLCCVLAVVQLVVLG